MSRFLCRNSRQISLVIKHYIQLNGQFGTKQQQYSNKNVLRTKGQQHERKERTKSISLSTYSMVYVTCRVMQNTNVVVRLNLDGHLATFNSSYMHALQRNSTKVEIKHCLHCAFCHILKLQISNIKVPLPAFQMFGFDFNSFRLLSLILHVQYLQQCIFIILLQFQMNNNLYIAHLTLS